MALIQPVDGRLQLRKMERRWLGNWSGVAIALVSPLLSPAIARTQNLSQRLPPPPPLATPGPEMSHTTAMPPVQPGLMTPEPFLQVSPNAVYRAPANDRPIPSDRVIVLVNGSSPLLLQQVRAIVPNAFIAQYQRQRMIQTGTFSSIVNAQRQVNSLRAQGIDATILTGNQGLAVGSGSNHLPTGQPAPHSVSPPPRPASTPGARMGDDRRTTAISPYLVIIPGSSQDLDPLTAQAVRLGVRRDAIQQRKAPLGPHLEIGPFTQRQDAEESNRYLRQKGMDARVFFNR